MFRYAEMSDVDAIIAELVLAQESGAGKKTKRQNGGEVLDDDDDDTRKKTKRTSWGSVVDAIMSARSGASSKGGIVDECRLAMRRLSEAINDEEPGETEEQGLRGLLVSALRCGEREGPKIQRGDRVALSRVLVAVDACYYCVRSAKPQVTPSPVDYFGAPTKGEQNPLLRIWDARRVEAEGLFEVAGAAEPGFVEMQSCGMKKTDPVATASLHLWRASTRTTVAREYSFAVPTSEILDVLINTNPRIIESGAGTGYWAWCLRQRGAKHVEAYDAAPPGGSSSSSSKKKRNAYHGHNATWTEVIEKNATDIHFPPTGVTLLVVYPPPDADAFLGDVATSFGQAASDDSTNRLALVGEWRGDTASPKCHAVLLEKFLCLAKYDLPNWGDTSAHLTIWQKKTSNHPPNPVVLDACSYCRATPATLFRCRLTCDVWYCSSACAKADRSRHYSLIKAKCYDQIKPPGDADWLSPTYWRRFDLSSSSSSSLSRKSRKKKKHQQKRRRAPAQNIVTTPTS